MRRWPRAHPRRAQVCLPRRQRASQPVPGPLGSRSWGIHLSEGLGRPVQDDVEVPHRYAELLGALVAVAILEESHPQGGGVAWIELFQGCVDRLAGLLDLGARSGAGGGSAMVRSMMVSGWSWPRRWRFLARWTSMARLMAMRRSQKKMLRSWLLKVSMRSSAVRKVSLRTSSASSGREDAGGWPGGRACLRTTGRGRQRPVGRPDEPGRRRLARPLMGGRSLVWSPVRDASFHPPRQRGRSTNLTQRSRRRGHVDDPGIS